MKDFGSLASLTPERILNTVHTAQRLPHHTWRELVPGDEVFNVGKSATSPNEKYYRLLAGQPLDDCLKRAAIRNLRIWQRGIEVHDQAERNFVDALPSVPNDVLAEFAARDRNGEFD